MYDEAVAVPVILGIVEVAKRSGLPSKFSPVLALLLGVGYSLLLNGVTLESGLIGLALGLSSSGLYSGAKSALK